MTPDYGDEPLAVIDTSYEAMSGGRPRPEHDDPEPSTIARSAYAHRTDRELLEQLADATNAIAAQTAWLVEQVQLVHKMVAQASADPKMAGLMKMTGLALPGGGH